MVICSTLRRFKTAVCVCMLKLFDDTRVVVALKAGAMVTDMLAPAQHVTLSIISALHLYNGI